MKNATHVKGIAHEVGQNGRIKVLLPEYEDMVTDWLPVVQSLTLGARTWAVPRKDTQVIVLPGYGLEDAVVLGAIYSKPDPAPFDDSNVIGIVADDDVEISYDPGASLLKIQSPKEINIIASNINIKADVDIEGNVTHSGDTEQTGNVNLTGNVTQSGILTTDSAIIGGIVFAAHKHPGVMSGPAVTAPPVP
jgi:phage baseplate assembly protein V